MFGGGRQRGYLEDSEEILGVLGRFSEGGYRTLGYGCVFRERGGGLRFGQFFFYVFDLVLVLVQVSFGVRCGVILCLGLGYYQKVVINGFIYLKIVVGVFFIGDKDIINAFLIFF